MKKGFYHILVLCVFFVTPVAFVHAMSEENNPTAEVIYMNKFPFVFEFEGYQFTIPDPPTFYHIKNSDRFTACFGLYCDNGNISENPQIEHLICHSKASDPFWIMGLIESPGLKRATLDVCGYNTVSWSYPSSCVVLARNPYVIDNEPMPNGDYWEGSRASLSIALKNTDTDDYFSRIYTYTTNEIIIDPD